MDTRPQTISLTIPSSQPLIGLFAALRARGLSIYCTGSRTYEARERAQATKTTTQPKEAA